MKAFIVENQALLALGLVWLIATVLACVACFLAGKHRGWLDRGRAVNCSILQFQTPYWFANKRNR